MYPDLLELLACPECRSDLFLQDAGNDHGGEIIDGALRCRRCSRDYPITGGIPRFAGDAGAVYENFEYQWKKWGHVQIDRLAGHRLSEGRLLNETGWDRAWFRDRLILDAGCGAGRFADVAAGFGARVIAVDISRAVNACRDNLALHGSRVHCIQGSIFALPLKREIVDAAYCVGVIQHTPDPEKAVAALVGHVRPGGRVAVNFYERDIWPWLQPVKYALRLFTPALSPDALVRLARALVAVFFPLTRLLARIRVVRLINHLFPICAVNHPALDRRQQYIWTLLDTYDWYGPKYEIRQRHGRIGALLGELGLTEIEARPGVARGIKPGGGPAAGI